MGMGGFSDGGAAMSVASAAAAGAAAGAAVVAGAALAVLRPGVAVTARRIQGSVSGQAASGGACVPGCSSATSPRAARANSASSEA